MFSFFSGNVSWWCFLTFDISFFKIFKNLLSSYDIFVSLFCDWISILQTWFIEVSHAYFLQNFLYTNFFTPFLYLKIMPYHCSTISFDSCYPVTWDSTTTLSFDWTHYTPAQCFSDSIWFIILFWYDFHCFECFQAVYIYYKSSTLMYSFSQISIYIFSR